MNIKKNVHKESFSEQTVGEFVKDKSFLEFYEEDTLYNIVNTMRQKHSYAAVIVSDSHLDGMVTENIILLYLLSWFSGPPQSLERAHKTFNVLRAKDVMIDNVQTISSDTLIYEALEEMTLKGFRYMPVLNKNKKPIGILNRNDIMQHIAKQNRKELESKDMMLSYLMHHENYGCV